MQGNFKLVHNITKGKRLAPLNLSDPSQKLDD